MTTAIQSVVNELVKRFVASNFEDITLTMKCNGEEITISPCRSVPTPQSIADIEYFLVYCSLPWLSCDSIEKLAESIINYPSLLQGQIDDKNKLKKFFNEHIKGHTSEELRMGNDFCLDIYDLWNELPAEAKEGINYVFDKKLDDYYLSAYLKKHPEMNREELAKAYDLSNDFSCYSDWFKDVHGFRPHSLDYFEG